MPVKDPFLAGVLALVPETDRAKAEARLIEMEEGELRQSDYSKVVSEARAAKVAADKLLADNQAWFAERKAALEEVDTLRARVAEGTTHVDPLKPTPEFKLPEDVITAKKMQERLNVVEREAVGFIAQTNALTMKHYQQFGEILDINDLLADPRVQQIGLQGVYAEKFKDPIAAKAKAADEAKAEAFRVEGEKRALERLASQRGPGYPVVGNEPSSLDAIEAARLAGDGKVSVKSLDELADQYTRLSASRLGGSPP